MNDYTSKINDTANTLFGVGVFNLLFSFLKLFSNKKKSYFPLKNRSFHGLKICVNWMVANIFLICTNFNGANNFVSLIPEDPVFSSWY